MPSTIISLTNNNLDHCFSLKSRRGLRRVTSCTTAKAWTWTLVVPCTGQTPLRQVKGQHLVMLRRVARRPHHRWRKTRGSPIRQSGDQEFGSMVGGAAGITVTGSLSLSAYQLLRQAVLSEGSITVVQGSLERDQCPIQDMMNRGRMSLQQNSSSARNA